jgi:hypothetical protein
MPDNDTTGEDKQAIGSFAVTEETPQKEEDVSISVSSIPQDTLEERLSKVLPPVIEEAPDSGMQNENIKQKEIVQENQVVQDLNENQKPAKVAQEATASSPEVVAEIKEEIFPGDVPTVQAQDQLQAQTIEQSKPIEYHTISGGSETFIEAKKKILETQPPVQQDAVQLLNMPKPEETLIKEVPQSLAMLVFKTVLIFEIIGIFLYYVSPTLLPFLVSAQYLTQNADGSYLYQGIVIPKTITTLLLHGAIVGGVLGLLLVVLGWIIDSVKETMHIALKVLILCVFVGGIMWLIIFLKEAQIVDLVGMVRTALLALGIVLFPLQ